MIYVCWDGGTLVAGSAYVILHEKVQAWIQSEISQNLKQLASGLMQNVSTKISLAIYMAIVYMHSQGK